MADTFFDFDTSLNNGDNLLPPDDDDDDDCLDNEEEYDALNDETFGALEDAASLDDWEQQHEQFAEIAESSRHSDHLETSITQLVLEESEPRVSPLSSSVWSYTPSSKNGDIFNSSSILSSLQKASKSFIESHTDFPKYDRYNLNHSEPLPMPHNQPKKICTVEELEKNLIKTSKYVGQQQHHPQHMPRPMQQQQPQRPMMPLLNHPGLPGPPFHPMMQHQHARHPPPGLPPMGMPPPGLRHMGPPRHPMFPPGMVRMGPLPPHPHFMPAKSPHMPPGMVFMPGGNQNQFPPNHPFNYPPPNRNALNNQQLHQQQQMRHHGPQNHLMHQQQQQRSRHDSGSSYSSNNWYQDNQQPNHHNYQENRDEYAGLMSLKEKQWLLNIQMLQLNTGTPYFDDYYYTIFKDRKLRNNKENFPSDQRQNNNNKRQHRNSDRQENQNTLTPKVYTPLQFENSLGKLQCGSVTAPRKIIDMDIVTPEKDSDGPQASRDTRKTKQLLLELEALYAYLLKAEDVKNPLYQNNMEKFREIKQKQRLRELELAPTPEQKREILRLFKLESEPIVENQYDYIVKIIQGLLNDEKFCSFLNIRKGKLLVLRLLPHLSADTFGLQLLELWNKVLLSLPVVGRRDQAGDNILPKLYPSFKRYIQSSTMSDILDIIAGLVEVVRPAENSRSTPLSHVGKSPLYFVLLNKFGVSALVTLLIRSEYLISTETGTEKQVNEWSTFVASWARQTEAVTKVAPPLEPIPKQIFEKHCKRFASLRADQRALLERYFVDTSSN